MMRNGVVYAQPMQALHTTGTEFSSLPTPTVADQFTDGLKSSQQSDGSLHSVSLAQIVHRSDLLPTVIVSDANGTRNSTASRAEGSLHHSGNTLTDVLLPTPIVRDYKDGQKEVLRNGEIQVDTVGRAVMNSGEITENTWGRFENSIRRRESVIDRKAPAATKPDGKDNAHRLSSKFTEWMMGLPDGWITDCGLSRNEELKACGNGVVPQQATMALQYLLKGK
jgi:DNA (cytosine-5)-methyltransferase 1